MKKLIILLLAITPLFSFPQGTEKNEITWITLEKARVLAKEHNQKILIFFYKKDCPYCEKMKKEALSDNSVINMINSNFFPVKINSRTKDTIYYNNIAYSNQQPVKGGDWFRHDFYAEVARFKLQDKEKSVTPSIVIFNSEFKKIKLLAGQQSKEQLLRNLKKYVK